MKLINVIGSLLFPLSLSLLLPVFLYAIVLEKEERLLQMMKMNGMKMNDYWVMQFIFCGLMSAFTFGLFYFVGYYVIELTLFTETNSQLLVPPIPSLDHHPSRLGPLLDLIVSLFSSVYQQGTYGDYPRLPTLSLGHHNGLNSQSGHLSGSLHDSSLFANDSRNSLFSFDLRALPMYFSS